MDEEVKVSELAEANIVNNEDLLMLVQNGTNKKVAIETLLTNTNEAIGTKVDKEAARQNSLDANDIEKSGFYYLGTGCSNVPETYLRMMVSGATGATELTQLAFGVTTGNVYHRSKSSNTWRDWEKLNITTTSNTNGTAIKFPDGTMICYLDIAVTDQAINSTYGSIYLGSRYWTFPQSFYSKPAVFCGMFKWGTSASWGGISSQATTSGVTLYGYDFFSRATGTTCYIQAMAIGRWK